MKNHTPLHERRDERIWAVFRDGQFLCGPLRYAEALEHVDRWGFGEVMPEWGTWRDPHGIQRTIQAPRRPDPWRFHRSSLSARLAAMSARQMQRHRLEQTGFRQPDDDCPF